MTMFRRLTDLIEPLSLDEAYLDVTENKTGLLTATQVARTIRKQIRAELQLAASAVVAPNAPVRPSRTCLTLQCWTSPDNQPCPGAKGLDIVWLAAGRLRPVALHSTHGGPSYCGKEERGQVEGISDR